MALTRDEVEAIAKSVACRVTNCAPCFETGVSLHAAVSEALDITKRGSMPTPDAIALIIQGMGESHGCGKPLEGVDATEIMKAYVSRDVNKVNKVLDDLNELILMD